MPSSSTSVTFRESCVDESVGKVIIQVVDACTRVIVPNAVVYIDGELVGVTNEAGKLELESLAPGKHSIRVVCDGYVPTDEDTIENDYFEI